MEKLSSHSFSLPCSLPSILPHYRTFLHPNSFFPLPLLLLPLSSYPPSCPFSPPPPLSPKNRSQKSSQRAPKSTHILRACFSRLMYGVTFRICRCVSHHSWHNTEKMKNLYNNYQNKVDDKMNSIFYSIVSCTLLSKCGAGCACFRGAASMLVCSMSIQ